MRHDADGKREKRGGAGAAALLLAAGWLGTQGCLEYGPNTLPPDGDPPGNERALARLAGRVPADPVRFAVLGDAQLAFDEAADAIESVASRDDLDFVVQVGDFSHHGVRFEFERMNEVFARLEVPYFVLLGNHDTLGRGREIFARLFGPADFTADLGPLRFVFFDSNSREAGFDGSVPDLAFLEDALPPEAERPTVLLAHVPPWDADFDPSLRESFAAVASRATVAFYGHQHRFQVDEFAGVPAYVVDALEGRSYLVATVASSGDFRVEKVDF